MRFVVMGAGAVGGVVGARLAQHGHQVVLVARGGHLAAIRDRGLRLEHPAGSTVLGLPAVGHPGAVEWRRDDVVLLTVKSHHTAAVLAELARVAPPTVAVACLQNGVANEPTALRFFPRVYGVVVACPTAYLQPGVVRAYAAPVTGLLDVGRFPEGTDDLSGALVEAFSRSAFDSRQLAEVMRWKAGKLVSNLGNAIEAVCGPSERGGPIDQLARAEGEACLRAAGIEFASSTEENARRGQLLRLHPVAGEPRPGGSTWQSLARRADGVETDYLNGEIVLLGRLHGVSTPVNETLQHLVRALSTRGGRPGALTRAEFFERLTERHPQASAVSALGRTGEVNGPDGRRQVAD